MKIGQKIRRLRKGKDMTLTKLAKKVETSVSHLSDIETGKIQNPSIKVVQKIADALEVTISEIVTEKETGFLEEESFEGSVENETIAKADSPTRKVDDKVLEKEVVKMFLSALSSDALSEEEKKQLENLVLFAVRYVYSKELRK